MHEAYVKLARLDRIAWQNRAQFLAIAAQAMRRVLVDYAVYRSAGDLEKARICLDEAVHIPQAVAAPEGSEVWWARLHVLHPYGRLLTELGDLDGALECLTGPVVWERARRYRLAVQVSYFCTAIAQVYLKKGAIDQTLHYYHEAVDIARNGRYQSGLAASLRLLGEFLLGIDRDHEAIGHLREAAGVLRTLKDVPGEALLWLRVGSAEHRLGRLEESRAAFDAARELRRGIGDRRGELEALAALAAVVRQCQPAAVALRTYQEAVDLAASLGADPTEASLQNAAGIIEWTRGRYRDALERFDRALALYTRLSDPAASASC